MKIIAHRGNENHNFKENTLDAILDSLNKEYVDGVEFDIRMTKDNKFILSHNPILYDTGIIKNKTLKELKKYHLDELNYVLKNIKTKKIILIDIKHETNDYNILIKKLNKILKKYKHLNIYLSSFNYKLIKELNKIYKTGLIISSVINRNKDYEIFDFVALNYKLYKPINKLLMLWTINKKEIMKKFINKDVFIITDKPYLVKEL